MTNTDVREAMVRAGVKQWQVAYHYGLNDGNFSRLLRVELPIEKKERILSIIRALKAERELIAQ